MDYKDLNQREISEHYVQACFSLDLKLVKYLLTSEDLKYKANINFDEVVFERLCQTDRSGEMLDYLMFSPGFKEHLNFSYPGFRGAMLSNNIAAVDLIMTKLGKTKGLNSYLVGDFGISELDSISIDMVGLLYFKHGDDAVKEVVLNHILKRNSLVFTNTSESDDLVFEYILINDLKLNHNEVLKKISKYGKEEFLDKFLDITGFDNNKNNIEKLITVACKKGAPIELLENFLQNPDYINYYYPGKTRIMKKLVQHERWDLAYDLIINRDIKLTDSIKSVMSPEVENIFLMRDLENSLEKNLRKKSSIKI